jgi:hypothetical protein
MSRIPRGAIAGLIRALTVTDWSPTGWEVVWQSEPLPFEGLRNGTLGAYIELGIKSYRSVGVDDYRQAYNPATGALVSVYYGLRLFTLTIDARSFAEEIPAWDVIESIRLQLNNPRSVTARIFLAKTGLSWIRSHPAQSLNYVDESVVDNRMIWRMVLDVEFSWLSAAQVTDDAGGWIATVGADEAGKPQGSNDVTGTLYGPDGNPWPSPANGAGFTGVLGWELARPGNIEPGIAR